MNEIFMNRQSLISGYIPSLDGLRGIAIVLVVLYHVRVQPFDRGGFIGVDIFFVLSGFLITTLLLREFQAHGRINYKNFYIRRGLRLAPAFVIAVGFFNAYSIFFLDRTQFEGNLLSSFYALLYIGNIAKALGINDLSSIGHTWSLSMEEQFYLVFPLSFVALLVFAKTKQRVLAALIGITLASWLWGVYLIAVGTSWHRVHFAPDTRFYELLIGCALAVFVASFSHSEAAKADRWLRVPTWLAWLSTGVLLLIACTARADAPSTYYYGMFVAALLTALLILFLLAPSDSILKRVFELRWLVLTGRISYGWYLYHQLIFVLFLHSENRRFFIGIPVSLALALLSYYFIEQPILRLKTHFRTGDEKELTLVSSTSR